MHGEIVFGNGELLAAHIITVNAVNFSNACFFKNGKPVANSTAQIEDAVRSGPLHDQRDDDLRALSGAVSESGVVGQIVHTRDVHLLGGSGLGFRCATQKVVQHCA